VLIVLQRVLLVISWSGSAIHRIHVVHSVHIHRHSIVQYSVAWLIVVRVV